MDLDITINWQFTDHACHYVTTLKNGVFTAQLREPMPNAAISITLTMTALPLAISGAAAAARELGAQMQGDDKVLTTLASVLDPGDPQFNIMLP